jgi:hypothetical protein
MARQLQPPFWVKVIATFTGCAAIGALVGVLGGALTKDVGRGLLLGVLLGAAVALWLVVTQPDRIRGT